MKKSRIDCCQLERNKTLFKHKDFPLGKSFFYTTPALSALQKFLFLANAGNSCTINIKIFFGLAVYDIPSMLKSVDNRLVGYKTIVYIHFRKLKGEKI